MFELSSQDVCRLILAKTSNPVAAFFMSAFTDDESLTTIYFQVQLSSTSFPQVARLKSSPGDSFPAFSAGFHDEYISYIYDIYMTYIYYMTYI